MVYALKQLSAPVSSPPPLNRLKRGNVYERGKVQAGSGKAIAKEIEKVFEAKVKPETLTMKASRMQSVTNVTPEQSEKNSTTCDDLEKLENTQKHGGKRQGSGRKPKEYNIVETDFTKGATMRDIEKSNAGLLPTARSLYIRCVVGLYMSVFRFFRLIRIFF
jgi:hypothetical protein